jgi:hypothetical protein
MDVM